MTLRKTDTKLKDQLSYSELKVKPLFILEDLYLKELNFNYKCRIGKSIHTIQQKISEDLDLD